MGINTYNTELPTAMLHAVNGMTEALKNRKTFLGTLAGQVVEDTNKFINTLDTYNTNEAKRYLDSVDPTMITQYRNTGISDEDMYKALLRNKGFGNGVQMNINDQDLMNKYGNVFKAEGQKRDLDVAKFYDNNANDPNVLGLDSRALAEKAGYYNLGSNALRNVDALREAARGNFLQRLQFDFNQSNLQGQDYMNQDALKGFNASTAEINGLETEKKNFIKKEAYRIARDRMLEDEANKGLETGTLTNSREIQLAFINQVLQERGWDSFINPEEFDVYNTSSDADANTFNKGITQNNRRNDQINFLNNLQNNEDYKNFNYSPSQMKDMLQLEKLKGNISQEDSDRILTEYNKGKARNIYKTRLNEVQKIIDKAKTDRGGNYTEADVLTISSILSTIHNDLINNDLPDNEFLEEATKSLNILSGSAKSAVDLTERLKSNSITNNKNFVLSRLDPTSQAHFYMNKIFEGDYKANRDNNLAYEAISKHIKNDNTSFSKYHIIEQLNKAEFKQSDLGKVITDTLGQAYNDYLKDVKDGKVKGYSTVSGFFNSKRGEQIHTLLNSLSDYDTYSKLVINYDNKKSLRTLDQAANK